MPVSIDRLRKELETGRQAKRLTLTKGKVAIVDASDYENLNKYKWTALKTPFNTFYAVRTVKGKEKNQRRMLYLHRVILDAKKGQFVDHVDGDGLNNTRKNLRLCTHIENSRNKGLTVKNTSGFKGVYWYKPLAKWQSYITNAGKRLHLGYFKDKKEAARSYDEAAKRLHGVFARLNFS